MSVATRRAFNFCSGPAALPTEVLLRAQSELLNWQGQGVSIMEVSHRSAEFIAVAEQAERDLRNLLRIPSHYAVLFMQGGATLQFSLVPMNLLGSQGHAAYLDSGYWASKAIEVAQRYLAVDVVASTRSENYLRAPFADELPDLSGYDYVHFTPNETVGGVAYDYIPDTHGAPLIADLSSTLLSEPLDVNRFDLIYAGAQKNIGPAGLCLVIVKRDYLEQTKAHTLLPDVLNYRHIDQAQSLLNTPPTFAWYLSGLVFEWLLAQGGLEVMQARNATKAKQLYDFIDSSACFQNSILHRHRSKMNVPFMLTDEFFNKEFLAFAEQRQLLNLKGHRVVGGMRASLYNAVPHAAVDALVDCMIAFSERMV